MNTDLTLKHTTDFSYYHFIFLNLKTVLKTKNDDKDN